MKSIASGLLLSLIFCSAANSQSFSKNDFKGLQSLQGLWKMESGRGALYEEWHLQSPEKFAGKSYKIKSSDTMVLERVDLYLQGRRIFYTPVVTDQNNRQPVPFKLISNKDNRYIFENKEHDYPQRVIYHFISKDSLQARIEGTKNGKAMGSNFFYSRVR